MDCVALLVDVTRLVGVRDGGVVVVESAVVVERAVVVGELLASVLVAVLGGGMIVVREFWDVVVLEDGALSGVDRMIDPVPVEGTTTVADNPSWVIGNALGTCVHML